MPDLGFVPYPQTSPTHCVRCLSPRCPDGFVDFKIDIPVKGYNHGHPVLGDALNATFGRFYLCAQCLHQAGRLVGMLDPQQAEMFRSTISTLDARVTALEGEVATERDNRVISFEDARRLLDGRRNRPAREPA